MRMVMVVIWVSVVQPSMWGLFVLVLQHLVLGVLWVSRVLQLIPLHLYGRCGVRSVPRLLWGRPTVTRRGQWSPRPRELAVSLDSSHNIIEFFINWFFFQIRLSQHTRRHVRHMERLVMVSLLTMLLLLLMMLLLLRLLLVMLLLLLLLVVCTALVMLLVLLVVLAW